MNEQCSFIIEFDEDVFSAASNAFDLRAADLPVEKRRWHIGRYPGELKLGRNNSTARNGRAQSADDVFDFRELRHSLRSMSDKLQFVAGGSIDSSL